MVVVRNKIVSVCFDPCIQVVHQSWMWDRGEVGGGVVEHRKA